MKKFMVLYMAPSADFEKLVSGSTPEGRQAFMDAWMKWMEANKAAVVDMGAPLGRTTRVDAKGASAVHNNVGGYSVVQAESAEAAAKLFGKDHPHLAAMPSAWIELIEIMPM